MWPLPADLDDSHLERRLFPPRPDLPAESNSIAIHGLLGALNQRRSRKLPRCHRDHFEQLGLPVLQPLPVQPYIYAKWKMARVHIDYHVVIDEHCFSVHHALINRDMGACITRNRVGCCHRGNRIASHRRSEQKGRPTSVSA